MTETTAHLHKRMRRPLDVLVCVTGSVAAYKACTLVRKLLGQGLGVQVAMTRDGQRFVADLSFAALSNYPVLVDGGADPRNIYPHLDAARDAKVILVAPCSANTLAKLAHGLADNVVTESCLAAAGRVVVAPAMNVRMWKHAATQANVRTLRERGVIVIEPDAGLLAEGEVGEGRLADVDEIVRVVTQLLPQQLALSNKELYPDMPDPQQVDLYLALEEVAKAAASLMQDEADLSRRAILALAALNEKGALSKAIASDAVLAHGLSDLVTRMVAVMDVDETANWFASHQPLHTFTPMQMLAQGEMQRVEALVGAEIAARSTDSDQSGGDGDTDGDEDEGQAPPALVELFSRPSVLEIGASEDEIIMALRERGLLSSPTSEHHVRAVVRKMQASVKPEAIVKWLAKPLPALDGLFPIAYIESHGPAKVLQLVAFFQEPGAI